MIFCFEQTLTNLHLEALLWRFKFEHEIEVAKIEFGLGLHVVKPQSRMQVPTSQDTPARDFNF